MIPYEKKAEMNALKDKFKETSRVFDEKEAKIKLQELEDEMSGGDFWNDKDRAAEVLRDTKIIRAQMEEIKKINDTIGDADVALEFAEEDEGMEDQFYEFLSKLKGEVRSFELSMLLNDSFDINNTFLTIHAGAGGTESQDWTQMLLRMYLRWAERKNFSTEIIESQPGDEAGIKSVTILVKGEYCYGYLKHEQGNS